MSSKSQGGAQSFLRWRRSSPSTSLGPVHSLYSLPGLPPLQGFQDLSTPVSGRPGPHSFYRLLSLLLLRPLPLCLQLPVPPTPKSPRFTSQVYYLPCQVHVVSTSLSLIVTSLGVTGDVASSTFAEYCCASVFPQEGRLGILTLYPYLAI